MQLLKLTKPMNKLNFYIKDDKVFDTKGNEILPDEKGIVKVDIDGETRRFIRAKLVKWLEDNPDIRQAKIPKIKPIPSQYEAKVKAELKALKSVKPAKTAKPRKPREKKPIVLKEPKIKTKLTPEQRRERERQQKRDWSRRYRANQPRKIIGRPRVHAYDELNRRIDLIPKGNGKCFAGKEIECTTTGKVYKSMYQAGKDLGINREGIRRVAVGLSSNINGYQFKFI